MQEQPFNSEDRERGLFTHHEIPKNTAELQAQLMYDYYLSLHPEFDIDEFFATGKKEHEIDIWKAWNESSLRDKFRVMISQPDYKNRLDISLDEVKFYSTPDE